MKFLKKKLAMVLALAMVLTSIMVPTVSFAASTNSVDKIPSVKSDYDGWTATTAPKLRIEEKNIGEFGTTSQVFRLQLTNAEWETQTNLDAMLPISGDDSLQISAINRISDTIVEVTMARTGAGSGTDKASVSIPLLVDVAAAGEVQVTLLPVDSAVSGGTYTFANAASGSTVASISKADKFSTQILLPAILIDETAVGTITANDKTIKLRLPNGFEWADNIIVAGGGGYAAAGQIQIGGANLLASYNDAHVNVVISGRDIEITDVDVLSAGTRGSIVLSGLTVKAMSDAKFGEVVVNIGGSLLSSQDLKVAEYIDFAVTAKADDDPKELVAAEYDNTVTALNWTSDSHKLQKLVIEENATGAWLLDTRRTRIEFPAGIKIIDVVASDAKSGLLTTEFDAATLGKNYVEYSSLTRNTSDKAKIKLQFYVSVEADFTGDIVATVSGTAIGDPQQVVLGKAIAPVTSTSTLKEVIIGKKNQAIGDITVVETKKEMLKKDGILQVVLDDYFAWTKVPTIKVTDGDLMLDVEGASVSGRILSIKVKSESSKPSTIAITDAQVDLSRAVPEGKFEVGIGGNAIVRNNGTGNALDNAKFNKDFVVKTAVADVVTPAPVEVKNPTVVFTIDSTTYTVDGKEVAADVAPFIKDSRTMVPVRFVAQALGVAEDNVIWNGKDRTVTILGNKIVQLTIGSKTMLINGAAVSMDTSAIISSDRTFVPISWIAKALGVDYVWDSTTKTVTFN